MEPTGTGFPVWLPAAATAVVWWMAIRMLWNEWEIDPQYSYGFLVPILCVSLFLQRWRDRPAPVPPPGFATNAWLAAPQLLFLAGLQVFFEANPEWRVSGLLGAFCAVGLTLLLLHSLGGTVWLRHFFFPVAFFLIAVPWPRNFEEAIMSRLMENNAIAAVEALQWCGHQALRQGHLIALPTGVLGVEEACSGVRSLQSGIMAALFFGEMFRFSSFVRVALVGSALLLALIGNFLRTTALSTMASLQGVGAIERWHDIAGYAILFFTLGSLWGLSAVYQKFRTRKRTPAPSPALPPLRLPPAIGLASLVVLAVGACSLIGTELWYRAHESPHPAGRSTAWSLSPGTPGTKVVPVSARTLRMLFFPKGFSERYIDAGNHSWQIFYFYWPAGRTAVQALGIHDPRTCLGSLGMVLERQLPTVTLEAHGIKFPFRVFLFRDRGRAILVFHSIIAEGRKAPDALADPLDPASKDYTMRGRWNTVKHGIRNQGQHLIEAAVKDTDDVASAAASLRTFLNSSVLVGGQQKSPAGNP